MANSAAASPNWPSTSRARRWPTRSNGFIGHAADGLARDVRLNVATAYFNVGGGYSLIAYSLDKLRSVRLLIGAKPGPPERRPRALEVADGASGWTSKRT
ncbi:MAG: hypothetical protein F4Z34_09585 [Acidimicrobiaceae bacterium]|nr:hypothetical protein [Acidimicrobiaceae bacterium]